MTSSIQPSIAWTIAGSDSGGGAGIQADLHTFQDFAVHGCSVITALTAQNSVAIYSVTPTETGHFAAEINALDNDLPAKAIKLGMLGNSSIIEAVSSYLQNYQGFVVCDPVIRSTSGQTLLDDEGLTSFKSLLQHVDLLTPNIAEAEALTGLTITTTEDIVCAAQALMAMGAASVLITGGHFPAVNNRRVDYWCNEDESFWLSGEDIPTPNSHGSGCTLSAAIAAAIALDYELADALVIAKAYITQGIRHSYKPGNGGGPVAHRGFPGQLEDLPFLLKQPDSTPLQFASCETELGLYPVVDSVEWLEKLMPSGITTIQLRIKNPTEKLGEDIKQAVALASRYQVRLFINDYWQLAIEHGAYGVHLGQEDLDTADLQAIAESGLRLGVSTHSYYEIARAHAIAPSYIAIGPIYSTTTKVMKFSERGLQRLEEWVKLLQPRYIMTAIGGINVQRTSDVLNTGVKSCAMVTAITLAENYQDTVRQLLHKHAACQ